MGRKISRVPALPFCRWAGGKRSIIEHLIARVPKDIKTYYEPFLGGGALFFALASRKRIRFERAYLSDTNVRLMRTYAAIAKHPLHVIRHLSAHAQHHGKRYYLQQRAKDVDRLSDQALAAWFIYLNKTCFNGLYRVNKDNGFNVPMDPSKKASNILDEPNLMRCAMALDSHRSVFTGVRDFRYVLRAKPGDFVYLDPPYYPISKTSNFTAYGSDGFADAMHVKLRDVALTLKEKGVRVLISNSNAPRVREIYSQGRASVFVIEEVQVARAINSKGDKRGKIPDLLIT